MPKWLIKREDYIFDYSERQDSTSYKAELLDSMNKEGQDGWEPWHLSVSFIGQREYVAVWYKKSE